MPENHGRDFGNSTNLDRLATQLDPEVRRRDVPVVDINNLADHLTNMSRGGGQGMVNVRLGDGNVVPVGGATMTIADESNEDDSDSDDDDDAPPPAPKRGGVDYSKWDNLEDSD